MNDISEQLKAKRFAKGFYYQFLNNAYSIAYYYSFILKCSVDELMKDIVYCMYDDDGMKCIEKEFSSLPGDMVKVNIDLQYYFSLVSMWLNKSRLPKFMREYELEPKRFITEYAYIIGLFFETSFFVIDNGKIKFDSTRELNKKKEKLKEQLVHIRGFDGFIDHFKESSLLPQESEAKHNIEAIINNYHYDFKEARKRLWFKEKAKLYKLMFTLIVLTVKKKLSKRKRRT